ncbi:hypothetical protein GCM10009609_36060 [Pseudonocardia aurantiaca]|uniref:Uncharacterized protein n=1 Tax=Pseudonocardia aurantiaca TaxID=75290 RepID=A0ABW4FVQ3_9PSEU
MTRTTHVDVIRPGRALVTGPAETRPDRETFAGGIVRDGRYYIVEDEYGMVIGRARSYRAGAERLARHYDTDPGHIEITYERDSDGQWSGDINASRAAAEIRRTTAKESRSPRRSG